MPDRDRRVTREQVLLGLGCFILGVWTFAVVVQVLFPSHVVPTEVHGIAGVVATALFGGAAWAARNKP